MSYNELKPCPFCGCKMKEPYFEKDLSEKYAYVKCSDCEACGPDTRAGYYDKPEDGWGHNAIKEWNKRS